MRVVLTVFGVFHHFDLARELARRGELEAVFSTWPWHRLRREGLPKSMVHTFPWVHTPEFLARRAGLLPRWLEDRTGRLNAVTLDRYTCTRVQGCDVLVGISGSSLRTGAMVQRSGGRFICDRGSSHQRFQEELVADEHRRWGFREPVSDAWDIEREEMIYDLADAITVPSSFAARSFVSRGVPQSKVHTIPYGVRLEKFGPASVPPPPPTDRFEVLFVGGVNLRKGIPYLLQAFAAVSHPNKRLRIIGAMSPEVKEIVGRFPTQHVEWLGSLPQDQVAKAMGTSHLLVLPSIEEGLALVQGQALACGCPVLGTTNSGAEDLLTDEGEGFVVPIRDPGALRDRMQRLIDDPDLWPRMRAAALERVRTLGGWDTYGDRWHALLHSLKPDA